MEIISMRRESALMSATLQPMLDVMLIKNANKVPIRHFAAVFCQKMRMTVIASPRNALILDAVVMENVFSCRVQKKRLAFAKSLMLVCFVMNHVDVEKPKQFWKIKSRVWMAANVFLITKTVIHTNVIAKTDFTENFAKKSVHAIPSKQR